MQQEDTGVMLGVQVKIELVDMEVNVTDSTIQKEKGSTRKTNLPDKKETLEILTQLFHNLEIAGVKLDVTTDETNKTVSVVIKDVKLVEGVLVLAE